MELLIVWISWEGSLNVVVVVVVVKVVAANKRRKCSFSPELEEKIPPEVSAPQSVCKAFTSQRL